MQPSRTSGEWSRPETHSTSPTGDPALMNSRPGAYERREGRRFQLNWRSEIKGNDSRGASFEGAGILKNLSSGGALPYLKNSTGVGAKLNILIKIPFKNENWMGYCAEALRVERHRSKFRVAVKFNFFRPKFWIATADSKQFRRLPPAR